jgi:hypothetical protein
MMATWGEPIYSESVRCEKARDIQHTMFPFHAIKTQLFKRTETEDKNMRRLISIEFSMPPGKSTARNLTKIPRIEWAV